MKLPSSLLPVITGLWVVLGFVAIALTTVGIVLCAAWRFEVWRITTLGSGIGLLVLWFAFRWPLPRVRTRGTPGALARAARRRAENPPVGNPDADEVRRRDAKRRSRGSVWRWPRVRRVFYYSPRCDD